MDTREILKFCLEKGLLIDKEILNLFSSTDSESAKFVIEGIKTYTNQRVITKNIISANKDKFDELISMLPEERKEGFKRLKIKLGLSIEISEEIKKPIEVKIENEFSSNVKLVPFLPNLNKKIEVGDFVRYFRNRFLDIKKFLQERPELTNLISIDKISGNQSASIIGTVFDKRVTKNKNIILDVEDMTGKIKILVNQNKKEVYEKAEDIPLDGVIGFKGNGNKEIFFANEIYFPEAALSERKKSPIEENALFISDVHAGSKLFLEKNFLKFVDYLNGRIPGTDKDEIDKIKYLFIVGDLIAGVGVYPNQEKDLEIKDIEGQYAKAAELFGKIRKDIKLIILPGNHDCVRLMEPQPILDEKYAWPLFDLKNAVFTSNPSMVNIGSTKDFSGFDVLTYHGFSYYYYGNTIQKLISQNAIVESPDKIMAYLLQNRHLAPTHASIQYYPAEKDPLLIRKVPDIFVSGHTHKGAASYYNNILVLSSTCWEHLTAFQEKVGNKPDFCKVPMFNLKTRNVKILDFYDKEELNDKPAN